MNTQSSAHCWVVWLLFQRSLPSTPQHQREVLVWLLRMTANPASDSAVTTASKTWSGVSPRSCGLAATAESGTAAVAWIIALENGNRTLLMPSSRKSDINRESGARSRPSGMPCEFCPAWCWVSSDSLPLPVQDPCAPSQLADFSRNRSPFASTM